MASTCYESDRSAIEQLSRKFESLATIPQAYVSRASLDRGNHAVITKLLKNPNKQLYRRPPLRLMGLFIPLADQKLVDALKLPFTDAVTTQKLKNEIDKNINHFGRAVVPIFSDTPNPEKGTHIGHFIPRKLTIERFTSLKL